MKYISSLGKLPTIVVLCAVQKCVNTGIQIYDECRPNRVLKTEEVQLASEMAITILAEGQRLELAPEDL